MSSTRPQVRIGPGYFVAGVLGVGVNAAGGILWLGVGPARFITGALMVALASAAVASFIKLALHYSSSPIAQPKDKR